MRTIYKNETHDLCIFMVDTYVGDNVKFFPNSVIGRPGMAPGGLTFTDYSKDGDKPVSIGDNTIIGVGVVLYSDVTIGKNCLIGDGVAIRGNVTIGDNCIVGINCKVGVNATVGNNTKIMDLTNVSSDAVIGSNVFIGPGVMMGNDNSLARSKDWAVEGPIIEDWVTIGMNSSLLPGVTVGRDAMVGANSVVTKDVMPSVVVMGVPARYIRDLKEGEIRC